MSFFNTVAGLFAAPKPDPKVILQGRINAALDTLNELLKEVESQGFDLNLNAGNGMIEVKVTPKPIVNRRIGKSKPDGKGTN